MKKPNRNKIKIGRNDPCFCGSGLKYKKCCLRKKRNAQREQLTKMPVSPKKITSLGSITPADLRNFKVARDLLNNQQKH